MPKILIADDNTNIQKMVSLALEERGINVVSVGNGEAAVRRIPDLDPDLVLADIFMPVRNGYEVCEFVKKDERFAHVPVILLVGAFDPLDEKEARRVGADGVLKKPFVPPDPLIAMVTSALEKNPRVAAELAKAKEAKMAPEPEPLPSIDLSARPEPKPLPEFPDPTPEEEALLYGMGKGQRSLETEDLAGGEPPAPVADPHAHADEDEPDGAETTSRDWRRTAMELEIPADVANKPAIPTMDDSDAISFPSEKDYPPRHVRAPEPVEDVRAAEASETLSNAQAFSLRQVEESEAAVPHAVADPSIELLDALKAQSAAEPPMGVHGAGDVAAAPEPLPEPNSTSAGGHWLDAVSSSQADQPAGGWMEALTTQQRASHPAPVPEYQATTGILSEPAPEIESSSVPAVVHADPAAPPQSGSPLTLTEPAGLPSEQQYESTDEQDGDPSDNPSFFADETANPSSSSEVHEQDDPSKSFAGDVAAADSDIEQDADDAEPPLAFKDPALVEPPGVHVTPEPLLVDEEAAGPAQYGAPSEETTPLHSFFAPGADIEAAAAPYADRTATAEFSVQAGSEPPESSADESEERIPTMPPPNREALAQIPFLVPPPSVIADLNSDNSGQDARDADAETVDSVVQKVLQKLEPQLHELLSQGLLKPLVENLLQNELSKKK